MKKIKKIIVSMSLAAAMISGVSVSAASSGSTYINSKYGYLHGAVSGGIWGDQKNFSSSASTTVAVPRLRTRLEVKYYTTGGSVLIADPEWEYDTKRSSFLGCDTYKLYNKLTKSYDGFVNTKLTAYGTADAITSTPYVVYTSMVS